MSYLSSPPRQPQVFNVLCHHLDLRTPEHGAQGTQMHSWLPRTFVFHKNTTLSLQWWVGLGIEVCYLTWRLNEFSACFGWVFFFKERCIKEGRCNHGYFSWDNTMHTGRADHKLWYAFIGFGVWSLSNFMNLMPWITCIGKCSHASCYISRHGQTHPVLSFKKSLFLFNCTERLPFGWKLD